VKDRRIKGSTAVHFDRMIRTTDVNRKQSTFYTSQETKTRECARGRDFCFLQHAEAIK